MGDVFEVEFGLDLPSLKIGTVGTIGIIVA